MTNALIAITILWGFVFIYAIMASMDFGAGFWSMVYLNRKKQERPMLPTAIYLLHGK